MRPAARPEPVEGRAAPEKGDGSWGSRWGARPPRAALAQAPSRGRLGILVSGNPYRHPAVLAKMATTVDHISGGRLEFGIGGAWHTYQHQAVATPFHTTRA